MVGQAICEAFGLDPRKVRRLTLHCETGEVPTLDVELYAVTPDLESLNELRHYEIRERELVLATSLPDEGG